MHTLTEFNQLAKEKAQEELFKCCGSTRWVEQLMEHFPFADEESLFQHVRNTWYQLCLDADYLEAFSHHPKIGDVESLKEKFTDTQEWAGKEQSGVQQADDETIQALARYNEDYFIKFGYIFIVFATGKSAAEMLQLLEMRLQHDAPEELEVAMGEQHKITLLRLQKLIQLQEPIWKQVSQITTHVLDTSLGKPGYRIGIKLRKHFGGRWQTMALGVTNQDGRIANLLPAGVHLSPAHYQMWFDTKAYFDLHDTTGFYPEVTIDFNTFDDTHYHVPLLLNPYGYSTYRGS